MLAGIIIFFALAHIYTKPLLGASAVSSALNASYSEGNTNCVASSYLRSVGILGLCTQAFNITASGHGKPETLVASVYRMNTSGAAQSYIRGITYDLNTTPWAPGAASALSMLQVNGTSIYFTTMEIFSHGTYITTTAYLLVNNTILGATAEAIANETTYAGMQRGSMALLYLLYNTTLNANWSIS